MPDGKPHLNVSEVLRSYSRDLLHDFKEGARALAFAFERGEARENAVREFLRARLPGRYGVGEGIVIDAKGGQSKQCDVVIYDAERTPKFGTRAARTIWPFEFVYAVAEVKSILGRKQLEEAVANISAFKSLARKPNNLVGGRGFKTYTGVTNGPYGILIAHDVDAEVAPDSHGFQDIVDSVPQEQRIDTICVISDWVGFRAVKDEATKKLLVDLGSPEIFVEQYGEGALAVFLMLCTEILNRLDLGEPHLFEYLQFVTPPSTPDASA
jgi:hypothetical protein